MANCEPFNDRLLDFVYGLLDEADTQALRGHLDVCPTCQETLRGAHGQQTLFARAALPIGAEAVPAFAAPAGEPPAVDVPAVDGTPVAALPATIVFTPPAATAVRRHSARRYWFAGAAAAAVLLLVGTLAYTYQDGLAQRRTGVVKQEEIVREIDARLSALEAGFPNKAKQLELKLQSEMPPHLYAMAPAKISLEGAAVVQVAVNGLDGKPAPAKVTMRLTDADGKKTLDQKEVMVERGQASLTLGEGLADALRGQEFVHLVVDANTDRAQAHLDERLKVAAPTYVAHLMTNQTVYRPGELLLFRALVLDRASLTPPTAPIALRFALVDAKGTHVAATSAATGKGGIAAGEMAIAKPWADGQYELRVTALEPAAVGVRPHARKLQLARDATHIVQTDRPWYRAGDVVTGMARKQVTQNRASNAAPNAELYLNDRRMPLLNMAQGYGGNLAGGTYGLSPQPAVPQAVPPPPNVPPVAPQLPKALPDGRNTGGPGPQGFDNKAADVMAAANQLLFQFALPKDLDTSRVHVRIVLTDGAVRETYEQELSVVPARLSVDFFPEGGELIAGVPNRVYYRVRTPHGEPVNPEGRVIVLSRSDVLLDSAPGTGAGSFSFIPQVGETYSVRLTNPGGAPIELAEPFARFGGVQDGGLVLHAPRPIAAEGEPVDIVLRNPGAARRVLVVAQCRGRLVGQQWVDANGAETPVTLGALAGTRGLVRVTAYDAGAGTLKPLAERLIYRMPARRLDLTVFHLGGVIAPKQGQKGVQLEVRSRDEAGEPCNSWMAIDIADESIRGQEPNPLGHFFIAGDVQNGDDLDNAVLLAADNPTARQALDLFLGTVGWRRFQPGRGEANAGRAPVDAAFIGRENASLKELQAQLETKLDEALTPLRLAMQHDHAQQTAERQGAQAVLSAARAELQDFEGLPSEYVRIGMGIVRFVLLGLACLALAAGAWQLVRRHSATLLFGTSFACLSLCLIATIMFASLTPPTETAPQFARLPQHGPRPGWLERGHAPDVPAGLPTGPFALAAPAQQLAAQKLAVQPLMRDVAKTEEKQDSPTDQLLAAAREQHLAARQMRGKAATSKNEHEALRELRLRFDQALAHQQAGLAKKALSTKPPTAATAPAGSTKERSDPKKKDSDKPHDDKAELDTVRRAFIPDFVAGVEFDTLLWHPALFVNGGSAQIAFDVPASAGSYRVLLFGHSADGRLGFYEGQLEVQPDMGR